MSIHAYARTFYGFCNCLTGKFREIIDKNPDMDNDVILRIASHKDNLSYSTIASKG